MQTPSTLRRSLLLSLVGLTTGGLALVVFGACGFDPPAKNTAEGGGGGSGPGGPCKADPGQLPTPNCDNSSNDCSQPGCPIDTSKCGDPGTCLPLADNGGKSTLDFRIRRLNIAAPPSLALPLIQNAIVTKNIDLKAKQCGELGNGAFNWLIRLDKTANTLKTGGAPPVTDFLGQGYCFYNHTTTTGVKVGPADGTVKFDGDTFSTTTPIKSLPIPIFLAGDVNNVIVLPITDATITSVTISANNNCIGSFQPKALDSDCVDDPGACSKWQTAGAIGGYITLEEADGVLVQDLSESLCVLLTGTVSSKTADGKCQRDGGGHIVPKGDFCSTTKTAGGCQDSYWLAATFAASAAKINDGSTTVECQAGGGPVDSGADTSADAADATGE